MVTEQKAVALLGLMAATTIVGLLLLLYGLSVKSTFVIFVGLLMVIVPICVFYLFVLWPWGESQVEKAIEDIVAEIESVQPQRKRARKARQQ